jgi:hypothetical protein
LGEVCWYASCIDGQVTVSLCVGWFDAVCWRSGDGVTESLSAIIRYCVSTGHMLSVIMCECCECGECVCVCECAMSVCVCACVR